jgi:hypothetical protein
MGLDQGIGHFRPPQTITTCVCRGVKSGDHFDPFSFLPPLLPALTASSCVQVWAFPTACTVFPPALATAYNSALLSKAKPLFLRFADISYIADPNYNT